MVTVPTQIGAVPRAGKHLSGGERNIHMTYVDRPIHTPEHAKEVCNLCGKPSPRTICDACADRVRAEALDRKKHEEKRNS